jgi:hypothetical protein
MNTTLTTQTRSSLVKAIVSGSGFPTVPQYLGWGVGPGTASANDIVLFNPIQNLVQCTVSQTTTVTSGDTFQAVGTLTSSGYQTITNVGLFTTSGTSPTGTLSAQLNPGVTVVKVSGYNNFPNPNTTSFQVQMLSEVITVTSGNGVDTWVVTRGTPVNTSNIPLYTQIVGQAGQMFFKSSFTPIGLSTGDQIQFTISVQFT